MTIRRDLEPILLKAAQERPVVAVLGPRQSGKTTLVKNTFPDHTYVDLEDLETRTLAQEDPKRFLRDLPADSGIILDEIQNVPDLFSYIKVFVDENKRVGHFILTGSQNLSLADGISQSLAGRVAELTLMPLSINELKNAELLPSKIEEFVFKGCYPEVYQQDISIAPYYRDYVNTYIQKDVRKVINVQNLIMFKKFMKACAARTSQTLNQSSIAEDLGIAVTTVDKWLSILTATYTIFLLQPYKNKKIRKRLVKSPKLYFTDTALACSLLGIRTAKEAANSYLKGNLVETAIIADLHKQYYNINYNPDDLYYFRTYGGQEINAILDKAPHPVAIEAKSGKTIKPSFVKCIKDWRKLSKSSSGTDYIIYGGDNVQSWPDAQVLGWQFSGTLVKDVLS